MKKFLQVCFFLVGIPYVQAQQALQTPEQYLGYPIGTQFTTHDKILDYLEYLCKQAPAKCKMQTYGSTYEGRPLVVAFVSTEANISQLEEIRTSNLKRAGVLSGQPAGNQPVLAWLSYNVHGNESVSSEAVMQVMYDVLNPQNQQTQSWLQNTVLIIDPCENPDGRERYVQWYKQTAGQPSNVSPQAWEHHEPWPGGRPNHYLFDLNRDWAWQTQKETKARIALYNQWLPQLHADFHEMGVEAPYYFSPAAKPYHQDITAWQRQFQDIIGENNRKYFDANNWLYFTRERYDLFYPSYGDTWPTFNGAIGMTYEQGGSGRAGLAIARESGDTLTLVQRVAHHHTASLATIEAIATRSTQAVQEFEKYYTNARQKPIGTYKSYVIKASGEPATLGPITQYLQNQGITFTYASKGSSAKGFSYTTGKSASFNIQENDILISAYQPKSTLLKVLFEPNPVLEDSLTYDITSWAVPYAFGVEAYALTSRLPEGNKEPNVAGAAANSSITKPYAYVAKWQTSADLQFLASLLNKKVKARYTETPFEVNRQTFQPGSLIITRTGNEALGDTFDKLVTEQAATFKITLTPVSSGFVTKGSDFGSYSVRGIKAPKVAVLAGEGISSSAFGEVWHYFEQQIGYPITVIRTSYFNTVPLSEFDVLILPAGSYNSFFNDRSVAGLKEWVRAGGKLIAMESAASFLAGKSDIALAKKKATQVAAIKDKTATPYDTLAIYGNREREQINEEVLGSVYRITLDKTHPLAFGYNGTYFALLREAPGYEFMKSGWNVGILKKDGYISGYVGKKARPNLQDALILGVQDLGKGTIIYMADNPLFRGFWQSGKLLFGNAVFLVGN
ncbi:M14 family zinc carboxypeptidase [Rhodocytophaga aerolata]|uniref:M14 family zinc carboxypeptidase n=1 Tax=Rhodocytophaga aerolata TaxID=455078 RepID=A0ABT8R729_9BACT|nr:M14 family zinc carboxypeptidase [Rhodocytophaga aerolata]MDO1447916.1 M14 family zinc carboxypeptidase [Rhodocytophaga aerolata]